MVLGACTRSPVQTTGMPPSGMTPGLREEASASILLRLSPQDLRGAVDQEEEIWRRARQAAMFKMASDLLVRRMLVAMPSAPLRSMEVMTYTQKGRLKGEREAATGDFVQSFRGHLQLDLSTLPLGRVVGLETRGYMVGSQQRMYATLPARPVSLPAYVAVFKPQEGVGLGMYRLGAIGEITQILDAAENNTPVSLGNVEILVADRETEEGDLVVLLAVQLDAMEDAVAAEASPAEVVVTPQRVPTVSEPKVKK